MYFFGIQNYWWYPFVGMLAFHKDKILNNTNNKVTVMWKICILNNKNHLGIFGSLGVRIGGEPLLSAARHDSGWQMYVRSPTEFSTLDTRLFSWLIYILNILFISGFWYKWYNSDNLFRVFVFVRQSPAWWLWTKQMSSRHNVGRKYLLSNT